jgi:hypothetical protein
MICDRTSVPLFERDMREQYREWDGDEWQEHIARLLRVRYSEPGMYQEMPSRDKGDLGLEGFSKDGICYQCYGAVPPFTVKTLYENQRAKITEDIGKFINNASRLSKVFDSIKMKRWLLVVPQFLSTQLLEHCTTKKKEVIAAKLTYVDGSFDIGVITDAAFEIELAKLTAVHLFKHDLPVKEPAAEEIQSFASGNVALLKRVSEKAVKLPKLNTTQKIDEFTLRMVQHYLRAQSAADALRGRDPEQFESFIRCKTSMEEIVSIQSMVQVGDGTTVRKTYSEFIQEMQKQVSVSPHTADVFAWGAVADWLLRCPLDF